MSTSGYVQGFTISNTGLYVVTFQSSDIDVYDIDTMAYRRKIRVRRLNNACDIIFHANILYVSEFEDEMIHRIPLSDETSSHWSVNGKFLRLSMNKKGNVIVSCFFLNKIIEYTPTGRFVREIQVYVIGGNIGGLRHAIQLDDDQFVICHSTSAMTAHHRVCMIDSNGWMVKSYGERPGSGIGQMNDPYYLAIDRNGYILVVDLNNNRIIQLNASLEFAREVIPGSVGLKQPIKIDLHENARRLYIAEKMEPSITILDF